jgi:hypothetical protein
MHYSRKEKILLQKLVVRCLRLVVRCSSLIANPCFNLGDYIIRRAGGQTEPNRQIYVDAAFMVAN